MVRQKLGQHFLIDDGIAQQEVAYAQLTKADVVLEIGPGKGILTRLLAQKAKQVIAIEIDSALVEQLQSAIPGNVTLLHGDALKIDFTQLPVFTKIVSNLPFQISSPITFKVLEYPFSKAVFIYQKDFADRMVATPGSKEYCRLSVGIYYKTHCRILRIVPRSCFHPVPQVDSCIVEIVPRKNPAFSVSNEPFFFELTKQLFTHRRKKIRSTIKELYGIRDKLPYLDERVEDLTPEQIEELSNLVWKTQQ
jgi:16S rRNA (adenine1518-N6/adenine1519-N6)-dimethyltransferase